MTLPIVAARLLAVSFAMMCFILAWLAPNSFRFTKTALIFAGAFLLLLMGSVGD